MQKKMMFMSSTILVLLLLCGILSVNAGSEKMFTALYFTNSVAGNCGADATHGPWYAAYNVAYDDSVWVRVGRPGIATYKVTDGKNQVIVEGQQDMFAGKADNVSGLRLNGFGLANVDWGHAVNPIHVVIHFDDDLAGDLTADNPCLAGGGGKPGTTTGTGQTATTSSAPVPVVTFAPANVKIPQDPTDHIILRCGYDRIYITGTVGDSGVFKLVTLKLRGILAAGDAGMTVKMGNNGTLNMKHLGDGNFVVTWSGGRLGADGQAASGFAKSFTCTFK